MAASVQGIPLNLLNDERQRYVTFRFYPLTAVMAVSSLASKGFVYIGSGTATDDAVMCVFCEKKRRNWQIGDNIDSVHRQLCPTCPMVTGEPCNNIAMVNLFVNVSAQADVEADGLASSSHNNFSVSGQFESDAITEIENLTLQTQTQFESTAINQIETPIPQAQLTSSLEPTISVPDVPSPVPDVPSPVPSVPSPVPTSPPSNVPNSPEVVETDTSAPPRHDTSAPPRQSTLTQTHQPSYQELAIITERPKHQELAIRSVRRRTFCPDWPATHHLSGDDLCDAGFYFAGYGDCTRCFFCGGGLRNWDTHDNVWVEHARWFPRCAYIRQVKGQAFIAAVKKLNDEGVTEISYEAVVREMGPAADVNSLEKDPAVVAVVQFGQYEKQEVMQAAEALIGQGEDLSSALLLEKLSELHGWRMNSSHTTGEASASGDTISTLRPQETVDTLRPQIQQLRQARRCKVCLVREISVIYLPCGHFCSCGECAASCEACPVCRQPIRGMIRASIPPAPGQADS